MWVQSYYYNYYKFSPMEAKVINKVCLNNRKLINLVRWINAINKNDG